MKVSHKKAVTLQVRINRHYTEWLIFVDDVRVPPTNNLAERARRHGHLASDIYFELFTRPPDAALRRLYADASAAAK